MATTNKKSGGARTKQPAKPSASKSTGGRPRKGGGSASSPRQTQKPFRREVGAVVCLTLAVLAALGLFGVEAFFIDLFCSALKGLFGYGFWAAVPILVMAAYILALHRGRPVRLRLCCTLLFPLLLGAILHLFLCANTYTLGWPMLAALWQDGLVLTAGGAAGGALAVAFIFAFSKVGAAIFFIFAALLLLLIAFNRTLTDVIELVRSRPRPTYQPGPKPEPKSEPKAPPVRTGAAAIDLPLDEEDNDPFGKPDSAALSPTPSKRRLFDRKPGSPPPHELLQPLAQAETAPPTSADRAPSPAIEPTPQPTSSEPAPPPPPIPEIVREAAPPSRKLKPEETAQAAFEISQDIARQLEHTPSAYQYPPVSLLAEGAPVAAGDALGELRLNQARLADAIRSFGIEAKIAGVVRGPSVTRYEVELEQGVRLNKLTNLADDIALALGATGVRIAPIPDKISMVGIEVPNKLVSPVSIHEVIDSQAFTGQKSKVSFAVGKDIGGNCIVGNIAKLPHMLVAGTTGSGKSVCTNSLIVSLLYKATPDEVRLIMIDPKMVELGIYNGIPHLLIPVVTDPKKAAGALQWAVTEMMKRYRTFSEVGVRDLASFNAHVVRSGEGEKLPQVVVVIDELADLMLVAAKEVEESICRVAQMGRAAGMHLIIATQRPSADVITGLMKANIPSRIAFAVASSLESRIILDTMGAEKLVGRGDMLWSPLGAGKPLRVQGCRISDEEVASVVEFVKRSGQAVYDEEIIHEIEQRAAEKEKSGKGIGGSAPEGADDSCDELFPAAVEVVLETGMASVSMLQRRLKLGYSRAARLVDQMEEKGVVGPFEGSKPRQLLITKEQWQEMQFRTGGSLPTPSPLPPLEDAPPFDPDDDTADGL